MVLLLCWYGETWIDHHCKRIPLFVILRLQNFEQCCAVLLLLAYCSGISWVHDMVCNNFCTLKFCKKFFTQTWNNYIKCLSPVDRSRSVFRKVRQVGKQEGLPGIGRDLGGNCYVWLAALVSVQMVIVYFSMYSLKTRCEGTPQCISIICSNSSNLSSALARTSKLRW